MKRYYSKKWFCIFVNIFLFTLLLVITKSNYKSDYDTYNLYLLSGSFGNPPTELLHYNYGMHPYLGLPIKALFIINSNVNWYSITLISANFLACCVLFNSLLKVLKIATALMIYGFLFLVFECWFLLQINFTNTAIVLCIAGIILVLESGKEEKVRFDRLSYGILMLVLASLFRTHVLIPIIGISLPFIFTATSRRNKFAMVFSVALATLLVISSNYLQKEYYKKRINSWQLEENYRQAVYDYVNHPASSTNSFIAPIRKTEISLLNSGLFIDSSFLNRDKVSEIVNKAPTHRRLSDFVLDNYWFAVSNRLFFFAMVFIALFILPNNKYLLAGISSVVLCCFGVVYLFSYEKLPNYLVPSLLFEFSLLLLLFTKPRRFTNPGLTAIRTTIMILLSIWGLVRVAKINTQNVVDNKYLKSLYSEIHAHPDILFVVTDDEFPLNNFCIWDIPKNYKLENLLYKPLFLQNEFQKTLTRFNIPDLKHLPGKTNVLFWGSRNAGLEEYYRHVLSRNVTVSDTLAQFKGKVYSIK